MTPEERTAFAIDVLKMLRPRVQSVHLVFEDGSWQDANDPSGPLGVHIAIQVQRHETYLDVVSRLAIHPKGDVTMNERTFMQQLFLLRQDIEATPMLDSFAAQQRERWTARLGDLMNRRLAAIDTRKTFFDAVEQLEQFSANVPMREPGNDGLEIAASVVLMQDVRRLIAQLKEAV